METIHLIALRSFCAPHIGALRAGDSFTIERPQGIALIAEGLARDASQPEEKSPETRKGKKV